MPLSPHNSPSPISTAENPPPANGTNKSATPSPKSPTSIFAPPLPPGPASNAWARIHNLSTSSAPRLSILPKNTGNSSPPSLRKSAATAAPENAAMKRSSFFIPRADLNKKNISEPRSSFTHSVKRMSTLKTLSAPTTIQAMKEFSRPTKTPASKFKCLSPRNAFGHCSPTPVSSSATPPPESSNLLHLASLPSISATVRREENAIQTCSTFHGPPANEASKTPSITPSPINPSAKKSPNAKTSTATATPPNAS